jgi:hypothetical protein
MIEAQVLAGEIGNGEGLSYLPIYHYRAGAASRLS